MITDFRKKEKTKAMKYNYCKNCGALISAPSMKFCTSCGIKIPEPADTRSPVGRFFLTLLQCAGFWGVYFSADVIVTLVMSLVCLIMYPHNFTEMYLKTVGRVYPIIMMAALVLVVVLYALFYKVRKKNFFKEIKVCRTSPSGVFWLFIVGILANFFVIAALCVLYRIFPALELYSASDNYELIFENTSPIVEFIQVAIVVPIFEEILFRGIIYGRIRKVVPKAGAILMGAVIFAAAHMNLEQFFYVLPLGLLMCAAYEKFGSIFASIAIHIGFNGANEFINLYMTEVSEGWYIAIGFAALALTAIILALLFLTKKEIIEDETV